MKKEAINEILDRYLAENPSESDKAFLESWYNHQEIPLVDDYTIEERITDSMLVWNSLPIHQKPKQIKLWPKLAVAASFLLFLSIGIYFFLLKKQTVDEIQFAKQIQPGKNSAYLTLADGRKIVLDDANDGKLAEQTGITITKTNDGTVIYTLKSDEDTPSSAAFNTISTPNGGKYQIKLADGTSVWLNAASSLKFPVSFAAAKNRAVELKGEAYFEVTKDQLHPFTVGTASQTIEVLGTHFNINAYTDEPAAKTTLLEGSVKVSSPNGQQNELIIRPGEQAITNNLSTKVAKVNAENAIDWKNDEFYFKDMDFKTAMRKIARWYDIEVVYSPDVDTSFEPGGWISRKSSISSVLKMMEATGNVHFKAEGRRITITK